MIAVARHSYITLANKEVKTLLSGNSNAEHGKCGGTTAKRYPSLHAKIFLKLLHQNSKAVTSSAGYSESYSTCLISFYHHPLIR